MKLRVPARMPILSPSTRRWFALFAFAAALHVWVHLQTRQVGYEIGRIREIVGRLGQEKRELEMEMATLTSPSMVDRIARQRLGLGTARDGQMVGLP